MPVKDKIVDWFIRNIVIPRQEIIDKPGHIILKISKKGATTNLRELAFPERILISTENKVSEQYGEKGKRILYSIGKKFGYRYASSSFFPTLRDSSEKNIQDFYYYLVRYIESTYAHRLTHQIDTKHKFVSMSLDGYICCSENGLGYIMTDGGVAGICAFLFNEPKIEGIQTTCQGRGDKLCTLLCGPPDVLSTKGVEIFTETDLSGLNILPEYNKINSLRESRYTSKSLRELLDSKLLKYKGGFITGPSGRYSLIEASLMYIMELELSKLNPNLLFEISKDFGQSLVYKKMSDDELFVYLSCFVSAMGFGDFMLLRKSGHFSFTCRSFPWTRFSDRSTYSLIRGIVSGVLSEGLSEDISFNKFNISTSSSDGLVITSDSS